VVNFPNASSSIAFEAAAALGKIPVKGKSPYLLEAVTFETATAMSCGLG
jgi:hypothetical protein